MLSETFGMDNYTSNEPYYADVQTDDALFPSVQSCVEWDVLSIYDGERLEADKKVTAEEVASTASIAAGYEIKDSMFDENGGFNADGSVEFARQHGILPEDKKLSGKMSLEECEAALAAARKVYLTTPMDEKTVAVMSEDITDLTGLEPDEYQIDGSQMLIPNAAPGSVRRDEAGNTIASINTGDRVVDVGVGEVFVTAPTPENPSGSAYKVGRIEEEDGAIVITTEIPTLADLYEELDVRMTVDADLDHIIWADGVTASAVPVSPEGVAAPNDGSHEFSFLVAGLESPKTVPLGESYSNAYSYSFEWSKGNFEKNWSNQNSSAIGSDRGAQALEKSNFVYNKTPSIEDFGGNTDSWKENLRVENKFAGGYKISGNISINSITVSTDVTYKRTWLLEIPYGIEHASVQVTSNIASSLKLEGNLSEELKIATVPIPIAATGLSVSVDLYLYADASGSLAVRAEIGSSAKVEYSDGKLRHAAEAHADTNVDVAIEINFGADISATLNALGVVEIVDAGARAGGTLTAGASVSGMCKVSEENGVTKTTYQESLALKADLYAPIVQLYAGGSDTLIGSLGLSGSWDIMTKDKGAYHFELMNYEWVFWEETVVTDKEGNVTENESVTAGDEDGVGPTEKDRLDLNSYVLTISGEPRRLELDLQDGEQMPDVIWSSDDTNVAVVDETGLVSPVGTGYTIITVTLMDDPSVYVKCAVYVDELGEDHWQFIPANMSVSECGALSKCASQEVMM